MEMIAQLSLCSQVCLVRLIHSPVGGNVSSNVSASLFIFVFVVVYHSGSLENSKKSKDSPLKFTINCWYITLSVL